MYLDFPGCLQHTICHNLKEKKTLLKNAENPQLHMGNMSCNKTFTRLFPSNLTVAETLTILMIIHTGNEL